MSGVGLCGHVCTLALLGLEETLVILHLLLLSKYAYVVSEALLGLLVHARFFVGEPN